MMISPPMKLLSSRLSGSARDPHQHDDDADDLQRRQQDLGAAEGEKAGVEVAQLAHQWFHGHGERFGNNVT